MDAKILSNHDAVVKGLRKLFGAGAVVGWNELCTIPETPTEINKGCWAWASEIISPTKRELTCEMEPYLNEHGGKSVSRVRLHAHDDYTETFTILEGYLINVVTGDILLAGGTYHFDTYVWHDLLAPVKTKMKILCIK